MAREVAKKALLAKTVSIKKTASVTTPKKQLKKIEKKSEISTKKLSVKAGKKKSISLNVLHETVTKNVRIKISDNTKKSSKKEIKKIEKIEKNEIMPRNEMHLAILSPFRFPLPKEATIAALARTLGVFFVTIGAFFSLLNINAATGVFTGIHTQNLAQTYQQPTDTTMQAPTDGTQSSGQGSVPGTTTNPPVQIKLGAQSPLSDIVPIYVNVYLAQQVTIIAQDTHTGNIVMEKTASLVDNTNWKYIWDTKLYENATYKLRVVVKNQYGLYEHVDSTTYTIENKTTTVQDIPSIPVDPTGTLPPVDTASSTTSSSTTEVPTPPTQQTVALHVLEASPLHGGVAFKILANEASEVKMYARNTDTLTLYYVGLATLNSNNEWLLDWNSKNVPDGPYQLAAKATFSGAFVKSPFVNVSVDNVDDAVVDLAASTTVQTKEPVAITLVEPDIILKLSKTNPLNGFVDVYVESLGVESVELYAIPKSSLTPFFIGLAKKMTEGKWKFLWQTTQSPNGEYDIYARVKTSFGFTEGGKKHITILNEITTSFTNEQETTIDTLSKASETLVKTTDGTDVEKSIQSEAEVVYVEPVSTFIKRVEVENDVKSEIEILLNEFKNSLNKKINDLAIAIRTNDTDALQRVKNEIENLKKDVLQKLPAGIEKKKIIDDINSYISQVAFELQELTQKNETILRDRVGNAITFDTDKDGISDYDEVNLYKTNPFAADTDGDSYIDGTEIKLGYNPNDSRSEALVQYESPKETGIVRDDLLVVDSIITMADDVLSEVKSNDVVLPKKAFISGKGLPNSFVTLYIYSTPIVVTVKTDEQGSWSYIFDKELENGDHEVYVGITDNNGRVVAKSNPLPFVKTAEAFTKADSVSAAIAAEETQPSLLAGNMMLLVASIAVVALGLVLILLGFHVRERQLIEPVIKNA